MNILPLISMLAQTKSLRDLNLTELAVLYGSTQGLAPSDYVELLNCPRSKLTRAFVALEKAGYVRREVNREDRRGISVRPTTQGQAIVAKTLQLLTQRN
jgi:DNA-binding MarR family transcriptional regulator